MTDPIILLDGAMATQLAARGFELVGPLYSARALLDAPELVATIHDDYLCAGAQVLTTNSFGLHAATLALAGIAELQRPLVRRSVELLELVRERTREHDRSLARFRIAGSIPPRPRELTDDPALAAAEYRSLAEPLAEAGVDVLLLETFTSIAEAERALVGLVGIDLPIWLSVSMGARDQGRLDGARLIEGETMAELRQMIERVGIELGALMINCTQIDAIPAALDALVLANPRLPLGVSPHFGRRRHDGAWIERIVEAEVFADQMRAWLFDARQARPDRARFCLAGACCGSEPGDIAALRERFHADSDQRERAWVRLAELIP